MDLSYLKSLRYDFNSSSFYMNGDEFKIYAHKDEFLNNHILKTKLFFDRFINKDIINNFYNTFVKYKFIDKSLSLENFYDIIYKFIEFHDIGKISFSFQINKLNKDTNIAYNQKNILNKHHLTDSLNFIQSHHSLMGSLLFMEYYFKEYGENFIKKNLILFSFAYSIYSHHTKIKDILPFDEFIYDIDSNDKVATLFIFSHFLFGCFIGYDNFQNQNFAVDKIKEVNSSDFSFFYSYIFSLLILSDSLASRYYNYSIDDIPFDKWNNRIDNNLKAKMNQFWNDIEYNKNISDNLNINNKPNSINDLRRNMLIEASINMQNTLKNNSSKIFFLNMPTGGGKTNTSMKLALDVINLANIDRIVYAMPFVNIIEQNYDIIKDSFCLDEDNNEIRKIYSGTETIYLDEKTIEIAKRDDYFDFPVICTTFVTLFDSIIKNNKKYKYKLSALSNSVIILDEVQSLPLKNWVSLYYLINEISDKYNIYFIIMSATLPKFEELNLGDYSNFKYNETYLLKNPKFYFDHKFFNRNKLINFLNKSVDDENDLENYLLNVLKENFSISFNSGLFVLNTVRSSKLIFDILSKYKDEFNFDIDLLNSSILPFQKQKIIYKVNNLDKMSRYILVSTQSIEAGVDVSFDFVVRDFAILDSIEQVRGRCNRSNELDTKFSKEGIKGRVYLIKLFEGNKPIYEHIYDNLDFKTRIKWTNELLKRDLNYNYVNILNYYRFLSEDINRILDENDENFILSDRENIKNWNHSIFSKLNDKNYGINIINNKLRQYACFIEANVNIFVDDEISFNYENCNILELTKQFKKLSPSKFVFSLKELIFIKEISNNWKIIEENTINGKQLLEYYKFCKVNSSSLNQKLLTRIEFSSIINKFTINIALNDKELEDEICILENIDYFYVIPTNKIGEDEDSLYSMKTGFNYNSDLIKIL